MPGQFEESKHPRGGKGTESGGKFVSKGEGSPAIGGSGASPGDPAVDEIQAQRQEYKSKLGVSPKANASLSCYQGGWYASINSSLRSAMLRDESAGPGKGLRKKANDMVQDIDGIFKGVDSAGGTPEDMVVFRGASAGIDSNFDMRMAGLRVGHEMFDEGFVSTSTDQALAESFSQKGGSGKGYVFQIRVPKGSSAFKPADITGDRPDEQEVLLNRAGNGASFRVAGIQKGPNITRVLLDYEYIPE